MKILMWIILALLVLTVGFSLYVRLSPIDGARANRDPATAPLPPATGGWLIRAENGSEAGQVYDVTPEALLAAFDAAAADMPRTHLVAGSLGDGRLTYVSRTAVMGFPDLTTVSAVPAGDGARLIVYGRQIYGGGDMGVNRKRVQAWVAATEARLAP